MTRIPTLLCERCGYPLAGLPEPGFCPECGDAIVNSLPERRTGSPWQSKRSAGAWVRTVAAALLHPRRTLDTITIEAAASRRLAWTSSAVAGTAGVLGVGLPLAVGLERLLLPDQPAGAGATVVAGIVGSALATCMLMGLTWVEARGIRFFGARHGFRVSREVAWAVCGHGAAGWVLAAVLGMVGGWIGIALFLLGGPGWLAPLPGAGGIAAGFLFFEWFAWEGMRRCRYANPPGSRGAAEEQMTDDGGEGLNG